MVLVPEARRFVHLGRLVRNYFKLTRTVTGGLGRRSLFEFSVVNLELSHIVEAICAIAGSRWCSEQSLADHIDTSSNIYLRVHRIILRSQLLLLLLENSDTIIHFILGCNMLTIKSLLKLFSVVKHDSSVI